MGFTLEEKAEIGALLFEARLAAEAALMGLTTLKSDPAFEEQKTKITAVTEFQTQSSDAIQALHWVLDAHISGADNDNAPEIRE